MLILSAHAVPVDEHWVARMTAPFDGPAGGRGARAASVPWETLPGGRCSASRASSATERAYSTARARRAGVQQRRLLHPPRRLARAAVPLPAAEDLEWARRVVAAGWSVVYEPDAAVYHSHRESARAQAQRLIDINRVDAAGAPARTRRRTLREAAGLLYRDSSSILGLDEPLAPQARAPRPSWSASSRTTSSTSRERERRRSGGAPTPDSGGRCAATQGHAQALTLAQRLHHPLVRAARRAARRRGRVAPEHPQRRRLAAALGMLWGYTPPPPGARRAARTSGSCKRYASVSAWAWPCAAATCLLSQESARRRSAVVPAREKSTT